MISEAKPSKPPPPRGFQPSSPGSLPLEKATASADTLTAASWDTQSPDRFTTHESLTHRDCVRG